ncbi:MAG: DNA replication/repair protein RecF [Pseudomonadota bacterium]
MHQALTSLVLKAFRNYPSLSLIVEQKPVILYGENGSGKTNLLESLSLLVPGRGFRGASFREMSQQTNETQIATQRHHMITQNDQASLLSKPNAWQVSATAQGQMGFVRIGTQSLETTHSIRKRHIRINGKESSQSQLLDHLSMIWLTPAMDRFFYESPSGRRKFIDRLIANFDPPHLGRCTRYERLARQRLKILEQSNDPDWLNTIEEQMATTSVAICAARKAFIKELNRNGFTQNEIDLGPFPKLDLQMIGDIEHALNEKSALEVEEALIKKYHQSRDLDQRANRTSFGAGRSDLIALHGASNQLASLSSTGQQKSCLIAIILAFAVLCKKHHTSTPILLLDEINAHLDHSTRHHLFLLLEKNFGQIWMSGICADDFDFWREKAQFFHVKNGRIMS